MAKDPLTLDYSHGPHWNNAWPQGNSSPLAIGACVSAAPGALFWLTAGVFELSKSPYWYLPKPDLLVDPETFICSVLVALPLAAVTSVVCSARSFKYAEPRRRLSAIAATIACLSPTALFGWLGYAIFFTRWCC